MGVTLSTYFLYVDDIVLIASSTSLLRCTIAALQKEFSMKDLGELHHFIGMHVLHCDGCLFLSQYQYMFEKSCTTLVDTSPKVLSDIGTPLGAHNASDFRSLAGALQYLIVT